MSPVNSGRRKSKFKVISDAQEKQQKMILEKYENDSRKITSKISVKNILELKDYYMHQQDTQVVLMHEIQDLEQEKENKLKHIQQLKAKLLICQGTEDQTTSLSQTNINGSESK